ncbi:MAG: hypothetical protein WC943_08300 [Elusimicrobiota bacterium]
MPLLLALVLLLAPPARADLSLVQIVQSQTSGGESGLFGKTWVQVSGRKMRLVSGHARKVGRGRRSGKEPLRVIQIVDLDKRATLLLDPKARTVETVPLTDIRYAGATGPAAEKPDNHILSSQIEVERGKLDRDVGDLRWGHYRVGVKVVLDEGKGGRRMARMEQDLWLAPLTGDLQEGLLDLAAFETDYREATGLRFSPLDHWTYQMREVAAYLRVPEDEVKALLTEVRNAFPEVPGYPLASSISWWKDAESLPPEPSSPTKTPRPSQPRLRQNRLSPIPSFYPLRSRFQAIDFSGDWRVIDRGAGSSPQPLMRRRYPDYAVFQEELRRKVTAEAAAAGGLAKSAKAGRGVSRDIPLPFYQINTELDAFSSVDEIPAEDFAPPPNYKPLTGRLSR